jgi:hypothetical protein
VTCLTAGDTLTIRGGTYVETLDDNLPSGSPAAHVTLQAAPNEAVVIMPSATERVLYLSRQQHHHR